MGDSIDPAVGESPFFLIFTDLDGTLLDHETYEWKEALPALHRCKESHIPVILVSSKTRAEMDLLRRKLSLSAPFVSENGGGIFFPGKTFKEPLEGASFHKGLWTWSLGLPYGRLVEGMREIREELGWDIRGFSDMNTEEISRLTGLDAEASKLAAQREYDEPFIIGEDQSWDKDALFKAAAKRGLSVSMGGRFYHLHGSNDKGRSMAKILSWYKRFHEKVMTIALGDSPIDVPMLKLADYPVLVRGKHDFSKLKKGIPRLSLTRKIGPKGWNAAVLEILARGDIGNARKV
ncbi:MAG: HAD-IIB family hydrolase [Deltaproteobacteria bacterium]|nr:HAD-IIB family hydrolase [Deltaproteobacteria bacterium]